MSSIAVSAIRPISAWRTWAALPVLMAGTCMIVLDFFIVNVALPGMQVDLHASTSAIEWVVAGYGLTFASCLITCGRIGDQIGRRRAFAIGLALFTLASAACGLAADMTALIVARLVQGLAAALLSPNVLAIIGVVYHGPERVRAITVYGMVLGVAAAGAQLLGGLLIHADPGGIGWRSVFLINLPVGLVAWLLTPRLIPESRAASASGIDLIGTGLLTSGLTLVLLPLVEGRQQGWPAWTWLSLAGGPLVLGAFVASQRWLARRAVAPLLDLQLFRKRALSAGLLTQFVYGCAQASFFLVLALYLQRGRGLDALGAGSIFTIMASAYLVMSLRAPKLTLRHGRRLIALGALTLAGGYLLLLVGAAIGGTDGWLGLLAPGLMLSGAGMGLCITPIVSTVLSTVEPQVAGAVSGLLSTMTQLGNAVGVAITGVIFFGVLESGYAMAFELSLVELAALALMVAALTRTLPRKTA